MQSGAYSFFIVKEIVKDRHDIKGNERKHIEELGENSVKKRNLKVDIANKPLKNSKKRQKRMLSFILWAKWK